MQSFSRRGFQLRTASLETRVAYTGFVLLMLPGVATLLVLSLGRVGFAPAAIATYYRGGESEMSFPKTFWQLMEVSHFHLFSVPVVLLVLAHLLYATPVSTRVRIWLTAAVFTGAFLEAAGPWAIRYASAAFAFALLGGWVLLGAGCLAIVAITLVSMWGPESWVARISSPMPANGGDLR